MSTRDQFELKKKYPSLPQDWEEGMLVGFVYRTMEVAPISAAYTQRWVPITEVNDTDYWIRHKEKKPLFHTCDEDGEQDVYQGDEVFIVDLLSDNGITSTNVDDKSNILSQDNIKLFKTKKAALNYNSFYQSAFFIEDIKRAMSSFPNVDQKIVVKNLFDKYDASQEKSVPGSDACPCCGDDIKIPDRAYINLETYKVGGSVLSRTTCCGKLVTVSMHVRYEHSEYKGTRTEDDWGY